MKGFASRSTVQQSWDWLDQQIVELSSETVSLESCCGRVLASDVTSRVDVPMFDRAMMDGYAVRAEDTAGATNYNQLSLQVIGQALPNQPFDGSLGAKQAVRIMTGSPVPSGANAVLPVEMTEGSDETVSIHGEVAPKKHIGYRGEDIKQESLVFSKGRRLRPQDVGLLSSIGVGEVSVVRSPKVRIVVTGNELLPRGTVPTGFQIVDSNGPMLSALARRDGAKVTDDSIVPDNKQAILDAMRDDVDVVLISGGSSVGQEDHAPRLLAENGELAIHGVAMRPSSPSGMGRLDGRLVFLLPGNPVSCLCSYDFFAGRAIRSLAGRTTDWPYRITKMPLKRKLVSQVGRLDYARVAIEGDVVEPIAISGASILSSTTRADGFVIIADDSEGYPEGQLVDVYLYDEKN